MTNNVIKIITASAAVLLLLILPACNMTAADSLFTSMAQGSKLPAEYAIASGDAGLMLGCLSGLQAELDSGGLSALERGEIALDMIDLLAVLSNAMVTLVPHLLEGAPPTLLDLEDFYDSAEVHYLVSIAEDGLIDYGLNADPSPMQLFWGALGMAAYDYEQQSYDWGQVTYLGIMGSSPLYDVIVAEAELMAAQGTNPYFLPLLDKFRALIGDPNV